MKYTTTSEKILSGVSRKIIINVDGKTPLNLLYNKIGYKNQNVEETINFLIKQNILEKMGEDNVKIKKQELKEIIQNLEKIENGIQDYLEISDVCIEKSAYPWGIYILYEGENTAKKTENELIKLLYSKLYGVHRPVTWKLIKSIFETGRASIEYIIKTQSMYKEEYESIKSPLVKILYEKIIMVTVKEKEYWLFKTPLGIKNVKY